MSAPVFNLIFIVWIANILSVYLENKCIHLLLELIVPRLLDGCSGSPPLRKPCLSGILPSLGLHEVVAAFFMHADSTCTVLI